jgi:eukaryotic-like serine/threonine-protein kinase
VGSARGLAGAGVRARVALCASLPLVSDVRVGPLALALASRRELARDWIGSSATASLPERRLAARLLERSAREAVRRSSQGDDQALRLFRGLASQVGRTAEGLGAAWQSLLADRETLVWRHVAFARGILAGVLPEFAEQVEQNLALELSPTEWRRAATSLVASIAAEPDAGLKRALELLRSPLLEKDPGIAMAMLWGLVPAAYAEPEASEELLDAIVTVTPIAVSEGLVELRLENPGFGARAAKECAQALTMSLGTPEADDGLAALARAILRDLTSKGEGRELALAVDSAVDAFVETGTREAHSRARQALAIVSDTVRALEALEVDDEDTPESHMSRRATVGLLRDLDGALLESGALKSLLLLDRRIGDDVLGVAPIDDLDERLSSWLLDKESGRDTADRPPAHTTLHLRQLRALLHLIDGETTDFGEDQERRLRVRARWTNSLRVLMARLTRERTSPLRRAIAATVARAFDALVRDGAADGADVLLHAAMRLSDPADLAVLAEASMHPDVNQLLQLYAAFAGGAGPQAIDEASRPLARLAALKGFVAEVPAGATERTQAVRAALSRLARALEAMQAAASLSALVPEQATTETAPLHALEDAVTKVGQLTAGAHRRCGDPERDGDHMSSSRPPPHTLAIAVNRTIQSGTIGDELKRAVQASTQLAYEHIPLAVAEVVSLVLSRLPALPIDRPSVPLKRHLPDLPLPNWLPSRRMIGGFYVHRQLGGGAVGSVFLVSRAEDRHDPEAERFALKVPDYDATAARSLSEGEFLKLFREEASALLAIPEHTSLARFVTFDAGARPKPILVMELVEGVQCDSLIASGALTVQSSLALLDGVLAGLEAMHAVGVGHLDIKPSNIILRDGKQPVLVDFGLAGKHLRPGCATGCYGAPEVWGIHDGKGTPLTADVYSFGCLAYELLTGQTLFDAPTDVALVAAHLTHDGLPLPIKSMAKDKHLEPVAMFLFQCLRHKPDDRGNVTALRKELKRGFGRAASRKWPLTPEG